MIVRSLLVALCVFTSAMAQASTGHLVFQSTTLGTPHTVPGGRAVAVRPDVVQRLVAERARQIDLTVPLPSGELPLTLQRMSVVDMTSRITFMTDSGPVHEPLLPSLVCYRADLPDHGFAVFTFDASGALSGVVDRADGRFVVSRARSNNDQTAYQVVREELRPFTCGTISESISADLQRLVNETAQSVKERGERVQALDTIEMRIAVEGDYQFGNAFASRDAAMNYVTELVALLSTIYEREVAVRMTLGNVRIWETSSDPYPENMGVFSGLSDKFIEEYRTNMTSIDRDLAMFLTKRNGEGGIAGSIGGLCQEDGSYASGDVNASLEGGLSAFTWDVFMMAHEIGHVCGGLHTQSCIWPSGPLDSCVASEDGECVTWDMTRPTRGTIMSYCQAQLGNGGTLAYEFHPLSRNVVHAYIRSAACVGNEPPVRMNRLHGVLTDGVTGEPLAGVKLVLGRYIDNIVRQVPAVDGDTVTVTASDGSYEFTGLGYGIYFIETDSGLIPYPLSVSGVAFPNSVQVADTVTEFNFRVTRGATVEFLLSTKNNDITYHVNVFSEVFPLQLQSLTTPFLIARRDDSTFRGVAFVPNGKYIIVPTAEKTSFTPNKVVITVGGASPLDPITFVAKGTGLANQTTLALGIATRPAYPTTVQPQFTSGMPYRLLNGVNGAVVASGTVPEDGIIVVEKVPTMTTYRFDIQADTNLWVPIRGYGYLYPVYGGYADVLVYQERRRPLIARAYRMTVESKAYTPLSGATVLRDRRSESVSEPIPFTMPFPLRIIDRDLSEMHISANGFVSFSAVTPDGWYSSPFDRYFDSPFAICALGSDLVPGELYGDTTVPAPWSISYDVVGTAPDRILRVEWKNVKVFSFTDAGAIEYAGPLSFQIHIHENGVVEMLYDQPTTTLTDFSAQIGLRGNDIYDNLLVTLGAGSSLSTATAEYFHEGVHPVLITDGEQFTPGLSYHWEIDPALSVDEDDVQTMSIRPSVSSTSVELHGVPSDVSVRVVDLMGTVVRTVNLTGGARAIDVRDLASGRYTAVFTLEGAVHALPFLVTR